MSVYYATPEQVATIRAISERLGIEPPEAPSSDLAVLVIDELRERERSQKRRRFTGCRPATPMPYRWRGNR